MTTISMIIDNTDEIKRLRREHEFLLAALVEIEEAFDHCMVDTQLISVGIKGLRNLLGTDKIMDKAITPGLVRF